ncbi:hypothetical protein [Amycolatopsis sp. Hca4]|uniref:hypothetical protein n=1 Tax=Amycolatopsis sp. Hca4 TaxID=2742131 RepID=UPI001590744A|nr:hypothetical protein [Amycolatopsis sp. Hca4]QKV74247.1 hypothetical protein HUT10_11080 [Amycolatopsis sp. Hca4]
MADRQVSQTGTGLTDPAGAAFVESWPSTSNKAADKIVTSLLLPERRRSTEPVIPLPVAELGPLMDRGSIAFSLVRVGGNGVVAARMALQQLAWPPGQALRFSVSSGLLIVAPGEKPTAAFVPPTMNLTLPARLRSRCRVRAGDQVLLASVVEHNLLVVYPQHVLHTMLATYHDTLTATSGNPGN